MSYSPDLGGMPGGSFAPADFADAEDLRPLAAVFDIGGHGSPTPYSAAVQAMLQKHTEEIRGKTVGPLKTPGEWKKRLREFIAQKNTDLLDFLKLSVQSHATLGPGEALLRRFGNPQVTTTHPSVRDLVMDVSGEDVIAELSATLNSMRGEGGLKDYLMQTRILFDEYRTAGEQILKQQAALKAKLDRLDRIQGKLSAVLEIDPNEKYPPLMEATEDYLKIIYQENQIEPEYKALIAAYRRFAALREAVQMTRALNAMESEPLCSVCLADPVSFALAPCGHTYCQTCMRKQNTTCFMCRTSIKDRVKLFFG